MSSDRDVSRISYGRHCGARLAGLCENVICSEDDGNSICPNRGCTVVILDGQVFGDSKVIIDDENRFIAIQHPENMDYVRQTLFYLIKTRGWRDKPTKIPESLMYIP